MNFISRYPTEELYYEHVKTTHVQEFTSSRPTLPCTQCSKKFRVSKGKGAFMRTPVFTLLNHLVEKHGIMRPDWAPVYK